MLTIVDSPGDPSANSYVSLAFCDKLMTESVGRSDWAATDEEVRKAAIIEATRTIDGMFTWFRISTTEFQALDWPQDGQYDKFNRSIPDDVIPLQLKFVTCELAYAIKQYGSTAKVGSNVDMIKVGPITVDLDTASPQRYFETVDFQSLNLFGDYFIKRAGTAYNVKVQR